MDVLETGKIVADHDQMQQLLVAFGEARHRSAAGIEDAELKRHFLVGREPISAKSRVKPSRWTAALRAALVPRPGLARRCVQARVPQRLVFGPHGLADPDLDREHCHEADDERGEPLRRFHQLASRKPDSSTAFLIAAVSTWLSLSVVTLALRGPRQQRCTGDLTNFVWTDDAQ